MKIEELKIKDFLSHANTEVKFDSNVAVNVIIGQNGAGKTSIIQGILFSLFREGDRGNASNMVRRGAQEASIVMSFSQNGKEYQVTRYLSRQGKARDDVLFVEGNPLARGASAVNKEMERILGITSDVAYSTFIVKEGKILDVLDEKELADILSEIMKIDKLDKLIDSSGYIRSVQKELENKLQNLKEMETQIQKDEEYLLARESELKQKEGELQKVDNELQTISNEVNDLKTELDEQTKRREAYLRIREKKTAKEEEIRRLELELERDGKEIERIDSLRSKLEALKKYKEIESDIKAYQANKDTVEKQYRQLKIVTKNRENMEGKLKKKRELEPYYKRYLEISSRLKENKRKLDEITPFKVRLDQDINQLKKLEDELSSQEVNIDEKIASLKETLSTKQEELGEIEKKIGEIDATVKDIQDTLSRLEEIHEDKCPICGNPLDEEHKKNIEEEKKAKLSELQGSKLSLNQERKKLNLEIRKLNDEISNLSQIAGKVRSYLDRKARLEKEISDLQEKARDYERLKDEVKADEEILNNEDLESLYESYLSVKDVTEGELEDLIAQENALKRHIADLEEKLNDVESKMMGQLIDYIKAKIQEHDQVERELRELEKTEARFLHNKESVEEKKKELEAISQELGNLSYDEGEYMRVKDLVDRGVKKLQEVISRKSEIEGRITEMRKEIENRRREIEEGKAKLKDIPKLEKAHQKLTKLRDDLGDNGLKGFLISSVTTLLMSNVNDILGRFDLSFRNVEISRKTTGKTRLRTEFETIVYNTKGDQLCIENLSGGEKISLALAIRLALTKIITNPGFMILDEPTVHLDEERRKKLIEVIKAVNEVVPQILVITHDEEVLDAADVVFRVKKENGISKVNIENTGDGND
ncbi:AAA family ATPase [Sulfuracidifex tepidarius]|uniref:DNA double-strand break repair Rad50 ATPase n=1 Tax=Sulfuracidifex tepidarius TaxID=1294262 RepID=A0A510E7D0_9CREN|nr:SMC family ATPase [Sulfuracidifex tepidarius]BBG28140.1 DNA double-strand break repair Rad50 ATPase [Sulfuracidifex tepidarius]